MDADFGSVFTLFIQSGLHASTVQRLAPGIYTVGSELEADIILSDQDIEAVHLIVELDRRGLRLEPLQGAITIDGESVSLEPGGERHLAFPASFSIGATNIKITAPKDAVQSRRRVRMATVAAGIVFLAVVGYQILNPPDSDPGKGPASALMQLQEPLIEQPADVDGRAGLPGDPNEKERPRPAGEDVAMGVPDVTLDQAAAALRERLATDDFVDIEVKTAVDRIVVRG